MLISFSHHLLPIHTPHMPAAVCTAAAAAVCSWKNKKATLKWHQWLAVFLPCFEWIIGYDWRRNLVWDVLAGCSVGFMVVGAAAAAAAAAAWASSWPAAGCCCCFC
jgi:sulfate transporter 4